MAVEIVLSAFFSFELLQNANVGTRVRAKCFILAVQKKNLYKRNTKIKTRRIPVAVVSNTVSEV